MWISSLCNINTDLGVVVHAGAAAPLNTLSAPSFLCNYVNMQSLSGSYSLSAGVAWLFPLFPIFVRPLSDFFFFFFCRPAFIPQRWSGQRDQQRALMLDKDFPARKRFLFASRCHVSFNAADETAVTGVPSPRRGLSNNPGYLPLFLYI